MTDLDPDAVSAATIRRRAAMALVVVGMFLAVLGTVVLWDAWGWPSGLIALGCVFGGICWAFALLDLREARRA